MPRVSSKEKYTLQVLDLFKKYGLTLNMEQIAHNLGLTKKTLYNNFNSKPELIGTVLQHFYSNLEKEIDFATNKSVNAIDAFVAVSVVITDEISKLGQMLLKDISLYQSCPHIFSFTDRMNFYSNLIQKNLKQGISEGLYRKNLNIEYSTLFYTSAIDLFYRWDNGFNYFEESVNFHRELVKHHLYSVVNEDGLKVLEKYL